MVRTHTAQASGGAVVWLAIDFLRHLSTPSSYFGDFDANSLTFCVDLTFLAQMMMSGVIMTVGANQTITLNGLVGSSLGTTC